jgi:ABC-2 type transport system permease protein
MWKIIFGVEWILMKRDRGVLGAVLVFGVLVAIAAQVGANQVARLEQGFSELSNRRAESQSSIHAKLSKALLEDAPVMSQDPRDPLYMGQAGAAELVLLPLGDLAAVAVGQRALLPQAMRVSMGVHLTPETNTEAPMMGPTSLSLGAFDLAFLFVVLFPLVVIAMVYGVLSGERERGTLAMLLSQPISQQSLVFGKSLARAVMLLCVTLMFLAVGIYFVDVELGSPANWMTLGVMALLIVSWLLFWFGAGVFVNALGFSSANNALLLVGLWLGLVVILPGAIQVVLNTVFPASSAVHLMHEVRESAQAAEGQLDALVGSHDDRQKAAGFAKRVVKVQRVIAAKALLVLQAAHEAEEARRSLLRRLSYLSPATLMQTALEDLAGSGQTRHSTFESQAEAYHESFTEHFYGLIDSDQVFVTESFAQVPRFDFVEESAADVYERVFWAGFTLAGLGLILIGFAVPRLRHIGRLTR